MPRSRSLLILIVALLCSFPVHAAEPHWNRISSAHFSVLTNADANKAREVVVRFEQMRSIFSQLLMKTRINMSEPIEIIAFRTDEDYLRVVPLRHAAGGFFIPGEDRYYFVLNSAQDDPWRAISAQFAQVLLTYNYPPTPPWFDKGFIEYFSSLRMDNKQALIGGDPEAAPAPPDKSFVDLLNGTPWMTMPELFSAQPASSDADAGHATLFNAQSWIVMHYLLNQNKLPETGTYFGLVEYDKLSVEAAIQKAYGMSSAQFGQAVKDYFHSLISSPAPPVTRGQSPLSVAGGLVVRMPVTSADEVGASTMPTTEVDAQASVAEMEIRLPERRDQAVRDLKTLLDQAKTENAIAHRALAWDHIEHKEFAPANEELTKATFDVKDPWTRYYLALTQYRAAQASGQPYQNVANLTQDMHIVLEWDPEFGEAYNMLAMAQLEGGGVRAAMTSMRAAINLSPRNQIYLLNMAKIYLAGKDWDAATAMLQRLQANSNPQIAAEARKHLEDIPTLKKYGLPLDRTAQPKDATASLTSPPPPAPSTALTGPAKPLNEDTQLTVPADAEQPEQPVEPQPDKRPILFRKGKLLAVDCAHDPAALLTVSAGTKTLKLRTGNYKSLPLIGAKQFSCTWKDISVAVNYKAGGEADGDLVSIEVQ